jgi:outer membrane protein, heavy metal efflux system
VGAAAGMGVLWLASAAHAEAPRAPVHLEIAALSEVSPSAPAAGDPLEGAPVLVREALIRRVLERNPELEAARAGWQAALARPAQAGALMDPMLTYEMAPVSIFSRQVRFGQRIALSQRLPLPGKRSLATQVARAEAEAARGDFQAARLEMALMTSMLFDDLFVAHRALAVNASHQRLLREMRLSAEAQYVVGRASQQDPLSAEVELGMLERDRLMLESEREVMVAQLNGLLHREPHLPLPPPPETLEVSVESPPPLEALMKEALERRPELAGMRARVAGGEAGARLAERERLPDVMVMGEYNSMWMDLPHQFMVGVGVELPVFQARRQAAVDEASAMLRQMKREEARMVDEIRVEVMQARVRLVEAQQVVTLYRSRVLPAVNDQVAAARVGFEAGRNDFQALLEAERNQRAVALSVEEALADVQRRQAELQRALGRLPGLAREEELP